ncbi:hypothetical protein JCM10908_000510 [Rhodotorula pacifica]|uniref:1-phosphatidylinositol-4-phosphate 5-kinase n=1 Tax=Rhodotorula pacifica TaxID=1495444 RepID=UPI00316E1686
MTSTPQSGPTQAATNGPERVDRASPLFDKLPDQVPPRKGALPVLESERKGSCDLPVNPLFGMGEQIRVREVDRSRLLVQKAGVVLREGNTPRSAGATPALRSKGTSKERPRRPDDHDEHWHDRILAKAYEWGLAGNAGQDDFEQGQTLYLPVPTANAGVEARGAHAAVSDQSEGRQEGYASQVQDFREHDEKQDHYDAARIKLRSLHSEVHEILENVGFRTPVSEGHPPEVLTPQLDRPNGDRPPSPTTSSVQHQSSFYSATSNLGTSDTGHTSYEVPDLSVIPPRTDSPLSFASLSDVAPSTSTATYPTRVPDSSQTTPSSAGAVETALSHPSPALNANARALRKDRSPSLSSTGASEQALLPPFSVSNSSSSVHSRPLPERRSSRASQVTPTISSGEPFLGAPAPLLPSTAPATAAPPNPLRSSSGSRRSATADSSVLLSTPPIGTNPESATSSPATVKSRRFSSTSVSPGRLAVPSLGTRSQSFSPGTPILSAVQGRPPSAGDSGVAGAPGTPPVASMSYPPVGVSTQPMLLDDVETSIAAQAEVIRRQRQEKRLEAEKEQAKRERERLLERDRAAGKKERKPSEGSLSAPIEDKLPSGPGALIRRRVTRMGSGSSVQDGSPSTQGREGAGTPRDESAGRRGRGGSGREDDRAAVGVLVGNLIGQDHANYVLMYNMLTGIRIGVSRCQAKAKRPLTDADYTARHKFSFDIVGNELTPSVKYDFKFKDYAPWVFRELREYFYLDPSDYLISLTAKYILSELGSPGKSGSFFYFSRDYRFIIKTIRHSEHKFLRSILKEYHEHVKKNPHTLLSRFYGLHRVKLPRGKKIHFVIMNNLFPPHRDIHETYDLKGSAIGRLYPEEKAQQNPHATLKDLNWVQRQRQFWLGPEKKVLFEEQLRRDTELLQRLGIMDYSLLTGIHNLFKGNSEGLREDKLTVFQPDAVKVSRKATQVKRDADASALRKAVQRSDPQALGGKHELPETDSSERRLFIFYQDEGGMRATGDQNEELGVIYYLGIIDILTPFTLVKRLEHFFKGMKHNKHMISAVPPREYGDRFLAFIKGSIRGNDASLRPPMYEHEKKKKWGDQPPAPSSAIPNEKTPAVNQETKVKVQ